MPDGAFQRQRHTLEIHNHMVQFVQFGLVFLKIQQHAGLVFEIDCFSFVFLLVCDVVLVLHRRFRGLTVFVTVTVLRTVVRPRVLSVTRFLVCLDMNLL